jgi:hypothetical protein
MSMKFKALGLALLALCAMGAVAASSASATGIHGESEPTYLTASTTNGQTSKVNPPTLQLANGTKTTCQILTIHDHVTIGTATQEDLTVEPTFEECTTVGLTTHVTNTGGCDFTFKTTTATTGTASIVGCASPIQIIVTKSLGVVECTVSITNQTPGKPGVDFAGGTKGAVKDVDVTSTVEEVAYTVSPASGTVCGTAGKGKQLGGATLFGFKDTAHTEPTGVTIA